MPPVTRSRMLGHRKNPEKAPPPAASSSASQPPPAAVPASAGLLNDWLREQSHAFDPWDFGSQLRARLEHKEYFFTPGQPGQVDFRKNGGDPDNTYLLLRARVHSGYRSEWFGAFAEGQESSSTGDRRNPNPESDLFALRQAH